MASAYPPFRAWWVVDLFSLMVPLKCLDPYFEWTGERKIKHSSPAYDSVKVETVISTHWIIIFFLKINCLVACSSAPWLQCSAHTLHLWKFRWCVFWAKRSIFVDQFLLGVFACKAYLVNLKPWVDQMLFVVVLKTRRTRSWLRLQKETPKPERWRLLQDDLLFWSAAPAGPVSSVFQFSPCYHTNIF